jgi:tetratricopeptide (TPR) repeat protein
MLIPVIGLVQVGLQSHADRYTYLPQIGVSIAVTWLAADLFVSWRHRRMALAAAGISALVLLICGARIQIAYWRDSVTLWAHTLAVTSNNDTAHDAVCAALLKQGRLDEAIWHAQMALKIRPTSTDAHSRLGVAQFRKGQLDEALIEFQKVALRNPAYPNIHYNLATVLLEKGRPDDAIAEYQKQLELQTDFRQVHNEFGASLAREGQLNEALLHSNLGTALARTGRLDEALDQYEQALPQDPRLPKIHYNIAAIFLQKGRIDDAITHLQKELQIRPGYAQAHSDLGVALSQKGRMAEAIGEWQKTLELEPRNLNAQCNLAWVFATSPDDSTRNGGAAVSLAERAIDLSGGTDPRIFRLLGAAYAESGRFSDAIAAARRGADLASSQGNTALAGALEANIELFRENKPLRDANQGQR